MLSHLVPQLYSSYRVSSLHWGTLDTIHSIYIYIYIYSLGKKARRAHRTARYTQRQLKLMKQSWKAFRARAIKKAHASV